MNKKLKINDVIKVKFIGREEIFIVEDIIENNDNLLIKTTQNNIKTFLNLSRLKYELVYNEKGIYICGASKNNEIYNSIILNESVLIQNNGTITNKTIESDFSIRQKSIANIYIFATNKIQQQTISYLIDDSNKYPEKTYIYTNLENVDYSLREDIRFAKKVALKNGCIELFSISEINDIIKNNT